MSAAYLPTSICARPRLQEIAGRHLWLPPSKQAVVEELVEALDEPPPSPSRRTRRRLDLRPARASPTSFRRPASASRTATTPPSGAADFYASSASPSACSTSASAAAVFFAVSSHVEDLAATVCTPSSSSTRPPPHQDMLGPSAHPVDYQWDSRALLSIVSSASPSSMTGSPSGATARCTHGCTSDSPSTRSPGGQRRVHADASGPRSAAIATLHLEATAMIHEAPWARFVRSTGIATATLRRGCGVAGASSSSATPSPESSPSPATNESGASDGGRHACQRVPGGPPFRLSHALAPAGGPPSRPPPLRHRAGGPPSRRPPLRIVLGARIQPDCFPAIQPASQHPTPHYCEFLSERRTSCSPICSSPPRAFRHFVRTQRDAV